MKNDDDIENSDIEGIVNNYEKKLNIEMRLMRHLKKIKSTKNMCCMKYFFFLDTHILKCVIQLWKTTI